MEALDRLIRRRPIGASNDLIDPVHLAKPLHQSVIKFRTLVRK